LGELLHYGRKCRRDTDTRILSFLRFAKREALPIKIKLQYGKKTNTQDAQKEWPNDVRRSGKDRRQGVTMN